MAATWWGAKVAWKDLKLPSWFLSVNVIICSILVAVTVAANVIMANALLDMGESNMEGKGYWWNVRNPIAMRVSDAVVNKAGILLGIVYPLIQAIWLSSKGLKNHSLIFTIQDNSKPTKY